MDYLLRGDRVRMWAIVIILQTFVFVGVFDGREGAAFMLALMFLLFGTFQMVHRRATLFEAALPIDGRALCRARLFIAIKGAWLVAAIGSSVLLVRHYKFWFPGTLLLLEAAAVFSVTVLVIHQVRPAEMAVPQWLDFAIWPVLAIPAYYLPAAIVLAACGGTIAFLLPRTLAQAPKAYQVVGLRLGPSTPWRLRFRPLAFRWQPVLRCLLGWESIWPLLCGLPCWVRELFVFAPYLPAVFLAQALKQSPWLFSLPIRRRKLFRVLTVIFAIAASGFYVLGQWSDSRSNIVQVGYGQYWNCGSSQSGSGTRNVQVPLAFWRMARGGRAPTVEAPWGEKCEPGTSNLLGFRVYNPFSVAPANSAEFLDWQFQRAAQTVYGKAIPVSEYPNLARLRLTPIANEPRARLAALAIIWAGGLFGLAFVLWIRPFPYYGRRWLSWAIILIPLCLYTTFRFFNNFSSDDSLSALLLSRLRGALPNNLFATAVWCLGTLALAYVAAGRQFDKMEARFADPKSLRS